MTNPFKNIAKTANETQKAYEKRETSESESRTCQNCGAARPKDTNLTTCGYCGFKFMDIDADIKLQ
jgi:Zn finger protein HypA/HybF involved in hydrogenase expression